MALLVAERSTDGVADAMCQQPLRQRRQAAPFDGLPRGSESRLVPFVHKLCGSTSATLIRAALDQNRLSRDRR